MLANISNQLANYIYLKSNTEDQDTEVLAYGLQIIFSKVIKLALIVALAMATNTLYTTSLCLATYIALRRYSGGVHLSTYLRCLTFGIIIFIGLGIFATRELESEFLIIATIVVSLLGIISIIKWVPAGTSKKSVTDVDERKKQKYKTLVVLGIWVLLVLWLIKVQLNIYAFSLILGASVSFVLVTPLGYKVIESLDYVIDSMNKEVKNNV